MTECGESLLGVALDRGHWYTKRPGRLFIEDCVGIEWVVKFGKVYILLRLVQIILVKDLGGEKRRKN